MAKAPRPWIVAPHDPIQKLEDNLWTIGGQVPGMSFVRRMTIARRADGTLVFYNAIPVDDATLAQITAWGKPAALIIPNAYHRLDAHPFKERLGLRLYCAAVVADKVRQNAAVDGTFDDFNAASDPTVTTVPIDGTKVGETAMLVKSGARTTAVFADVVMNVPRSTGLITTLMRTAGGPKCPPLFRLAFVKKKPAVRASLESLAGTPGLSRLIPSHGDVLEGDVPGTLRTIAARDL